MTDRQKLIDVFMHMGDHIRSLDEYGFGFDSTLAQAIEDVVAMLKQPDANGVTFATDNNVGDKMTPTDEREAKLYWKPVGKGTWNLTCSWCDSHLGCRENAKYCPECGAKFVKAEALYPELPKGE